MAMGSYALGATVRIPLQVTDAGTPFTEDVDPTIKQIIRPDKTSALSSPEPMLEIDKDYGTYYYDYTPDVIGDYVVIITYTFDEVEFSVIENFTVGKIVSIPRAEAR